MPKCYDEPLAFESEIADDFYYQFSFCSVQAQFFFTSYTVTLAIKKKRTKKKETKSNTVIKLTVPEP